MRHLNATLHKLTVVLPVMPRIVLCGVRRMRNVARYRTLKKAKYRHSEGDTSQRW